MESDRVTYAEAAVLLGTYVSRIQWMVARGWIVPDTGRRPALPRAQVLAAPKRLQEERNAAAVARAERDRRRARLADLPTPPDDVHQWLRIKDAAHLMGVSRQAVAARARRGRLPSIVEGGIRWFRKDHLELVINADCAGGRRPANK